VNSSCSGWEPLVYVPENVEKVMNNQATGIVSRIELQGLVEYGENLSTAADPQVPQKLRNGPTANRLATSQETH
jgi:hypothetical protein